MPRCKTIIWCNKKTCTVRKINLVAASGQLLFPLHKGIKAVHKAGLSREVSNNSLNHLPLATIPVKAVFQGNLGCHRVVFLQQIFFCWSSIFDSSRLHIKFTRGFRQEGGEGGWARAMDSIWLRFSAGKMSAVCFSTWGFVLPYLVKDLRKSNQNTARQGRQHLREAFGSSRKTKQNKSKTTPLWIN